MVSDRKISEIVRKIASNYQPEKILLFGSYASGKAREDSDPDFIIIKKTNIPKSKRGREVRRHLLGSKIAMDLKVYTPEEFKNEKDSFNTKSKENK